MTDTLRILLTNDDGIDSPGIRAMYEGLSTIGDVTVVAPADDQSAVGRSMSHETSVTESEFGYALHGTPADCVVAGLAELSPAPDIVVSGCNEGANLGEYVLGRSGTIGAAVEAAFFEVPAIATSLYIPAGDVSYTEIETSVSDFGEATRVTTYLVEHALDCGVFEDASYLNVNLPLFEGEGKPIEITRPSKRYEMDASREGNAIRLHDRVWDSMDPETIPDPPGTDRRAVVEGRISVSPLVVPHGTQHHDGLDSLAASYPDPPSR